MLRSHGRHRRRATNVGPTPGDAMPHYARLALLVGGAIYLLPIAAKLHVVAAAPIHRCLRRRALRPRAVFALSAIHLTNMRITPLIYFKF